MALITNQTTFKHNYEKISHCFSFESLFNFLKDRVPINVFKSNIPQIENSKESKIAEVPDTALYHVLSFLETTADLSSFSRTNKAFFSLLGQMPADHLASDSMVFFLYGRHLFSDKDYSRHRVFSLKNNRTAVYLVRGCLQGEGSSSFWIILAAFRFFLRG